MRRCCQDGDSTQLRGYDARAAIRQRNGCGSTFPRPWNFTTIVTSEQNFRERERIKRKKLRWTARLKRMPTLERQSLLSAIAETAGIGDGARYQGSMASADPPHVELLRTANARPKSRKPTPEVTK